VIVGCFRHFSVWLGRAAFLSGFVTLLASSSFGQSQTTGLPIGVEAIKGMLTRHEQWTFYWDRAPVSRPRLGSVTTDRSPSVTLEFMRVGPRLIGYAYDDQVHRVECEFEVAVREDGFTFAGCWGSDKSMTYDPNDREYPFKGRVERTLLWIGPNSPPNSPERSRAR
jgi:hypothetical protein